MILSILYLAANIKPTKVIKPKINIDNRCFKGAPAIKSIEKDTMNITTDEPRSGSSKMSKMEREIKKTGLKKPNQSSLNSSYFLMQ
tara:strand:+ start:2198 stop:2455 length:258 start_codon:yes stop_codon:yes gene_type:complete